MNSWLSGTVKQAATADAKAFREPRGNITSQESGLTLRYRTRSRRADVIGRFGKERKAEMPNIQLQDRSLLRDKAYVEYHLEER